MATVMTVAVELATGRPWRRCAGASLVLVAVAAVASGSGCQGLADGTTRGAPLLTLRGKLTLAPDTRVDGNVRLALAWYPGLLNDPSDGTATPACDFTTSLGIVSQDIEYRPNFPIDYAFDVTAVPAKAAQSQLPGGAGSNGALGAVVAYLDGNKNGVLDPCSDGGLCPDRVLGTSGSVLPGGLPAPQVDSFVGYVDAGPGVTPGHAAGQTGFFLVRVGLNPVSSDSGILPLPDTPIDITLSDAPILKSITCERLCVQSVASPCAVADADCVAPAWPKDTNVHCDSSSPSDASMARAISWLDVSACTVQLNVAVVEGGRAQPPWWPCP